MHTFPEASSSSILYTRRADALSVSLCSDLVTRCFRIIPHNRMIERGFYFDGQNKTFFLASCKWPFFSSVRSTRTAMSYWYHRHKEELSWQKFKTNLSGQRIKSIKTVGNIYQCSPAKIGSIDFYLTSPTHAKIPNNSGIPRISGRLATLPCIDRRCEEKK